MRSTPLVVGLPHPKAGGLLYFRFEPGESFSLLKSIPSSFHLPNQRVSHLNPEKPPSSACKRAM
jgi:hypothetical protein